MAKIKNVSHFERMTSAVVYDPVVFAKPYEVYDDEEVVDNGRVVKKSVIKVERPSERFAGMKASDFALENIIAAGAVDMLKPVVLHDANLDMVDQIDGTLNDIMDQIDVNAAAEAVESAEAPKNNENE